MKERIFKFIKKNVLIILLAFIPPILIWYYFQREIYEISISVEANIPIVSLQEDFSEDIEVFYRSNSVTALNVYDISLKNNGNKPIIRSDFDSPISIELPGEILRGPIIVEKYPNSIDPEILTNNESLLINPLLLNSGDYFLFRSYVANVDEGDEGIIVTSRIRNVNNINVTRSQISTDDNGLNEIIPSTLTISLIVSLMSLLTLVKRFKGIIVSFPFGTAIELKNKLQSSEENNQKVNEIAERLDISNHDYKSNLLLIRIKLEKELREIASNLQLSRREQFGGISRLTRVLERNSNIPKEITTILRDIIPMLSKELHTSDSYLSDSDYQLIQDLGLNIIAKLEQIKMDIKIQKDQIDIDFN
ncbi:MAG: hypothetical protein WEA79_01755 [Balneolaceae bacterium]